MNTELTLIRQMEKTLPMVLINNILSYRPAHHIALLVEEVKTKSEEALYVDNEDLLNGTFMDMTISGEDDSCFKQLLWGVVEDNGNWQKYCDLVRSDYNKIYLDYGVDWGIWNEEMDRLEEFNKRKFKMNEVITAITLIENGYEAEEMVLAIIPKLVVLDNGNIVKLKKTKVKLVIVDEY